MEAEDSAKGDYGTLLQRSGLIDPWYYGEALARLTGLRKM
jgi:hypothetical protein